MKFKDFEHILSYSRIQRYVDACNGDTRKAMTLYRLNLHLSQEMFTIVSCFDALYYGNGQEKVKLTNEDQVKAVLKKV